MVELATIGPADYAREVLPHSECLWAGSRTTSEYVADFLATAASPYGRRRFRTLGVRVDDTVAASLKRYERELQCQGRVMRAVGIGAVFTAPDFRGRGFASAMLGAFLDREREEGTDVAYLFSDIHPVFYERLGFIALPSRSFSIRADLVPVRRVESQPLGEDDAAAIARCFEAMETRRTYGLRRTPLVWDFMRMQTATRARRNDTVRLGVRRGRSLAAYVVGRREVHADAFVVEELAYASDDGRAAIPTLLRNAAGDLRKITGWLPPLPGRDALPRAAVRRRKSAATMIVPLSRAMRTAWRTRAETIVGAVDDPCWYGDHV